VVGCWRGYLSGGRCRLHVAQLMPLPLTACVRACVCVHVRCVEIDRLIINQAVVSRVAVSVPR